MSTETPQCLESGTLPGPDIVEEKDEEASLALLEEDEKV